MFYSESAETPATSYGKMMENKARELYSAKFPDFQVEKSGLIISKLRPYLAGSPDGLIKLSTLDYGVLEIKCPYNGKDLTIEEMVNDLKSFCSEQKNNEIMLKKSHPYYFQVQGLMHVTQTRWCHFLIYSSKAFHLQKIEYDKNFMDLILPKLKLFYFQYYLPEIISGSKLKNIEYISFTEDDVKTTFNDLI